MIYPKIRKGYYELRSTHPNIEGPLNIYGSLWEFIMDIPFMLGRERNVISTLNNLRVQDRGLVSIAERFNATINWEAGTAVIKVDDHEETINLNEILQSSDDQLGQQNVEGKLFLPSVESAFQAVSKC